jgi:IS30 family transposase
VGARYDHLTLDERRLIYRLREARLGVPRIAERLDRHRSTIYRELRRNWHRDGETREMNGYYPTLAHGVAAGRRSIAAFILTFSFAVISYQLPNTARSGRQHSASGRMWPAPIQLHDLATVATPDQVPTQQPDKASRRHRLLW